MTTITYCLFHNSTFIWPLLYMLTEVGWGKNTILESVVFLTPKTITVI